MAQCSGTTRAGAQCRNGGRYNGRCHHHRLPSAPAPPQPHATDDDLDAGLLAMLAQKKREEHRAMCKTGVSDACPPSLVSITSDKNDKNDKTTDPFFVPDLADDGDDATFNKNNNNNDDDDDDDDDEDTNTNNNAFKSAIVAVEAIYALHHTRRLFDREVNAALDKQKRAVVHAMYNLGDMLAWLEAEHGGRR